MARAPLATALRTRLVADQGVAALVGERVFPGAVPQGAALPAVVYQTQTDARIADLAAPGEMRRARVQFETYSEDYDEVSAASDAIEAALAGLTGLVGDQTGAAWVDDCTVDNHYDRVDAPRKGSSRSLHRRLIDFEITYRHTSPAI